MDRRRTGHRRNRIQFNLPTQFCFACFWQGGFSEPGVTRSGSVEGRDDLLELGHGQIGDQRVIIDSAVGRGILVLGLVRENRDEFLDGLKPVVRCLLCRIRAVASVTHDLNGHLSNYSIRDIDRYIYI